MLIAALYDIHGNLPALDAVLAEARVAGAGAIVLGGDVVPGPLCREALHRIAAIELPVYPISGNGERELLALLHGRPVSANIPAGIRETMRWVAASLDPAHERTLINWPATLRLTIDGVGRVLFCHATPRNDSDIFTRRTPEAALRPLFEGLDADLVVCGHTHLPFDRTIAGVRVVNAGSVGMPFAAPGAEWLLLGGEAGVTPRRTAYDPEAAAAAIAGGGYPDAAAFIRDSIRQPPGEAAMLERFARVELH